MAIKCIQNPHALGNVLAKKFKRSSKFPLFNMTELEKIALNFLVNSQRTSMTSTPGDGMDVEEFLNKFGEAYNHSIDKVIDNEQNADRKKILEDSKNIDWLNLIQENKAQYFTSSKVDPLTEEVAADEEVDNDLYEGTIVNLADDTVLDAEFISNQKGYSNLLLNLIEGYLINSRNPKIKTLNPSQLAVDFQNFLNYHMYAEMVDTRAEGKNLGFIKDKEILKEKLKAKMESISSISKSKNVSIVDLLQFYNDNTPVSEENRLLAKQVLFSAIASDYASEIATELFATPEFSWKQSWDTTNADSDTYLDTISTWIFTNSPRLSEDRNAPGNFTVDMSSPVLSEAEIKNVVLPKLANVKENSIDGIRQELKKHIENPVIKSIYTYYFDGNSDGYTFTDIFGKSEQHYSLSYAVDSAYDESVGPNKVAQIDRKFSGFADPETDLFMNRVISSFISVEEHNRGNIVDGKLKDSLDRGFQIQQGYKTTLTENIEFEGVTKKKIVKAISMTPVYKKTNVLDIGKFNFTISRHTEKGTSIPLITFQVELDEKEKKNFNVQGLKGKLGSIIPGTVNLHGKENNLQEALNLLGFQWALDNKFIKEYDAKLRASTKTGMLSLENLTANLALISVLNSDVLRRDLFKYVKALKATTSYKEDNGLDDMALKYDPSIYLNQFLGQGGPATNAINAVYNFKSSIELLTQENQRAASTVGITPSSAKTVNILNAQNLIKEGKETVLEGNEFVTEDLKIIGEYVKQGVELNGNILLLKEMSAEDRTISLIEQGLSAAAFSDGKDFRTIVIQAHQYADKTSPKVTKIYSKNNLISLDKNGNLDTNILTSKIIKNYRRKYNNLSTSIFNQWKNILVDNYNMVQHFMEPTQEFYDSLPLINDAQGFPIIPSKDNLAFHLNNIFNQDIKNLSYLNKVLQGLNINPVYIKKNPNLVKNMAFTITKNGVGIKNTSIALQDIFNDDNKARKLLNYHSDNFYKRLTSKLGNSSGIIHDVIKKKIGEDLGKRDKNITDKEAIMLYHLIYQYTAPQIEELTMGDSSQFKGDFDSIEDINFSELKNTFPNEEDYKFRKLIYSIDKGQSQQNADKSKRSSLLLTNGFKLALREDGKPGLGVGKKFHTATIEDPQIEKKILTGIKKFDNYDGIRLALNVVRKQVNASIGNGALMSKGEAHKDGYTGLDINTGAYRVQKMSTMYMTPEFISNSDLAYSLIKRMLTAIPYDETSSQVILPGDTQPTKLANAWDLIMKLENKFNLTLSDNDLWDYMQQTEAANPLIRGKYISYLTFASAEKTGSTGLDTNSGYGFTNETINSEGKVLIENSTEFTEGDIIQWKRKGSANVYETATVLKQEADIKNESNFSITVLQKLPTNEVVTKKLLYDEHGNVTLQEESGEVDVEDVMKSFNYSTLDYKNLSIILKAGKDAEYKAGVAKMIQAFNSILFNNNYVKDAINTVEAQGNIAESNERKLQEDIITKTMEEVIEIETIPSVSAAQLANIKTILTNKPSSSNNVNKFNERKLTEFFNKPEVKRLGLKKFVTENSKNSNIDPEVYKKMQDANYNFSYAGSYTDLMLKTFSTYIEKNSVKNRYHGGLMILSTAEDLLQLYEYDEGQPVMKKDLIQAMDDNGEGEMVSDISKSDFENRKYSDTDIIKLNGKHINVNEYVDSRLNGNSEFLYEQLVKDRAIIFQPTYFKKRKLKHTEVRSKDGLIEESKDYKTFIKFQKFDRSKKLDEDQFNIFKQIQKSKEYNEYDWFNLFNTYSDYENAIASQELFPNFGALNPEAINEFKEYIVRNKVKFNDKAVLNNPLKFAVHSSVSTPDMTLESLAAIPGYEQLENLITFILEQGLRLENEKYPTVKFITTSELDFADVPSDSYHLQATQQENVLNKIFMAESTAKNNGLDLITPFKLAKSNLITELQSTENGKPKYSTTDGELIIPFMYAKEFGLKGSQLPSISKILGYAETEEEMLANAQNYFVTHSDINFTTFDYKDYPKISGEEDIAYKRRALAAYEEKLIIEKANLTSLSGLVITPKEDLINRIMGKIRSVAARGDESFKEGMIRFKLDVIKLVEEDVKYTRQVKLDRGKSFVDYLKVYYGRIPGTGLQTNGSGKTVGFIQDMGNTAFLDSSNTLITGSDFDMDKVTMILRAVDNNGSAYKYDEWVDTSQQVNLIANELLKDPNNVTSANIQQSVKIISSDDFQNKLDKYINTLEKNLKETEYGEGLSIQKIREELNNAKKSYRVQFEKGMQNYILDQMRNITKSADVQYEGQTMVHMDNITEAKEVIVNKKLGNYASTEAKYYNNKSLSSFDFFGQMKLETDNFAGKDSVGPFANAQKSLALISLSVNVEKENILNDPNQNDDDIEDVGKFKTPITLIMERDSGIVTRTSNTFVNLEDELSTTGRENIILKKVIDEYRSDPENKDASMVDIIGHLNNVGEVSGINVSDAWDRKIQMLTREQGWESIGEFIQSATDNAKVLNLGPIGANQHTNSYFAFSLIAGFSISDTVEFLSNPKIKAISGIYENFVKKVHSDIDLKIYFGSFENIPKEFKDIFKITSKNTAVSRWPSEQASKLSIESLNTALTKKASINDKKIYNSFSQLIAGEEELRVLSGFIGLDGKHPNNAYDTINKFRSIGNNIKIILGRDKHKTNAQLKDIINKYEKTLKSPTALGFEYSFNDKFKTDINKVFAENINYLDALKVIKNNKPFSVYVKNLGTKMSMAGQLSNTPLIYLDDKFSGWVRPTFREHKILDRLINGLSVRTYLEKSNDAKQIKLINSDTKYNLRNPVELKKFLVDFRKDVEIIKENNPYNAFINYLKLDTDITREKDIYGDNKYYSLYISSNATPDELNYVKVALKELAMSKNMDERLFYKNLQLYALIVDGGLNQKNGLFKFMDLDMKKYNDHLETILNDKETLSRLKDMSPISVALNSPHLIKEIDTKNEKKSKSIDEEEFDLTDMFYQEGEDIMIDNSWIEEGSNRQSIIGDKETHIDQDAPLYRSANTKRIYYNALPTLKHIILTPYSSHMGRLPLYDNDADVVHNAGWQYGIPFNHNGNTIFVLRAKDDKSYYYVEDQDFISKIDADRQAEIDLDSFNEADIVNRHVKTISFLELLTNNTDWIFRKHNLRKQLVNEHKWQSFKITKEDSILDQHPDGFNIAQLSNELDLKVKQKRFFSDENMLKKANKAVIKAGLENGLQVYTDFMKGDKLNKNSGYKKDDKVAILVEENMTPDYKKVDAVMASGAIILTSPTWIRDSSVDRSLIKNKSIRGEKELATYLNDNEYKELSPGTWFKEQKLKLFKESRILLNDSYKQKSKKASKKVLTSLINDIAEKFPNVNVELLTTQEIALDPNLGNAYMKAKGFVKDGVVVFNTDRMTLDTPIHEFGHLYLESLKETNPELYESIIEESLNHELYDTVKETYPELNGSDLGEEIFVTALGLNGQSKVKTSGLGQFLDKVKSWWKEMLSRVFKISNKKVGEINLNDSLNTIIDKLGTKIVYGSDVLSEISTQDQQMITLAKKENMSYTLIENNLIEQGYITKVCTF
jgi:hypothetical protein